jgi:hypothetical protein
MLAWMVARMLAKVKAVQALILRWLRKPDML